MCRFWNFTCDTLQKVAATSMNSLARSTLPMWLQPTSAISVGGAVIVRSGGETCLKIGYGIPMRVLEEIKKRYRSCNPTLSIPCARKDDGENCRDREVVVGFHECCRGA